MHYGQMNLGDGYGLCGKLYSFANNNIIKKTATKINLVP